MTGDDKLSFNTTYTIFPTILPDGTPAYGLSRTITGPFASGLPSVIATNVDRAVLERAIEHLTKGSK